MNAFFKQPCKLSPVTSAIEHSALFEKIESMSRLLERNAVFSTGAGDVVCDCDQSLLSSVSSSLSPFLEEQRIWPDDVGDDVGGWWWTSRSDEESAFCDSKPRTRAHS